MIAVFPQANWCGLVFAADFTLHEIGLKSHSVPQDNLNIHTNALPYEAFPAAEVGRSFEWHYTQKTYRPKSDRSCRNSKLNAFNTSPPLAWFAGGGKGRGGKCPINNNLHHFSLQIILVRLTPPTLPDHCTFECRPASKCWWREDRPLMEVSLSCGGTMINPDVGWLRRVPHKVLPMNCD